MTAESALRPSEPASQGSAIPCRSPGLTAASTLAGAAQASDAVSLQGIEVSITTKASTPGQDGPVAPYWPPRLPSLAARLDPARLHLWRSGGGEALHLHPLHDLHGRAPGGHGAAHRLRQSPPPVIQTRVVVERITIPPALLTIPPAPPPPVHPTLQSQVADWAARFYVGDNSCPNKSKRNCHSPGARGSAVSEALERPDMRDMTFEVGALSGRMGAAEERMGRIEEKGETDVRAVHGRIDGLAAKLDSMSVQMNRWLGAIALGISAIGIIITLAAAKLANSGHF